MAKYEEPDFQVIESYDQIEIRAYKPMIIAEVEVSGERDVAISQGFRLIANYIFGNNESKTASAKSNEKIKMTVPVIQQQSETISMTAPVMQLQNANINNWLVQFVMPKSYTLKTLPNPNNTKVRLREVAGYKAVVIRFSGTSSARNLQNHLNELKNFVSAHKLNVIGGPIYAFYNPPWTLPFFRRNEIMLKLN